MDLNRILPLVQRPARYINHEVNSYTGKNKADVKVCLCFPDLFELGASNLGLEILYHIINQQEGAVAERCYSPDTDLEELIKNDKKAPFSLESKTDISEFDILGFTLQYELCATNVLNMLHLAGLPFLSGERKEMFPLIIGGGPVTANPEPFAGFFDAFVIGDGEEAVIKIIEEVRAIKRSKSKGDKKELLVRLANIPGVYVPAFYQAEYNPDGTIKRFSPVIGSVPEKIYKQEVNLEKSFYPVKPIVPYLQTVHDRLNIEIARGCARNCRFCQASKYYRPYRVRSRKKILELLRLGLKNTGYDEVSLSALSCTEYKEIEELLSEINKEFSSKKISISLPSLRCDRFSVKVANSLGAGRRPNLTFAPESGSERLRGIIGKDLSDNEIVNTLIFANNLKWKLAKLYFMIGLPTETEEDIDAIGRMVNLVKKKTRNLNFNITLSPFVPKSHTPFQWVNMAKAEVLQSRISKLIKTLPASVKSQSARNCLLEAAIACGDRRLSKVILKAWKKGCRFDQWREKLKYDFWMESFREEGLDLDYYLFREKKYDEILPWDHIVFYNKEKELLWENYKKSLETDKNSSRPQNPVSVNEADSNSFNTGKMEHKIEKKPVQRIRLRFSRTGVMRFISHLDQIEYFRRAMRRAGVPFTYSSGFHPQPKMSFGPAISVGYESESEYVDVDLSEKADPGKLESDIRDAMSAGFKLLSIKKIPLYFPSIDSLANVADYRINVKVSGRQIDELLSHPEIIVEKTKKKGIIRINVKPLIKKIEARNNNLYLQLRFGPGKTVKPEAIVKKLCGLSEDEVKLLLISRENIFREQDDGKLLLL
ncbi:MAG: TIGR03960 family B12-binding radical SAM protein [Endomicrobiales bacterium]|nr:TIGR03960 family B12-binding radical SAM protein [Endomicrobiales bacterium]